MNILVTGSNGFVGKNLCLELENNGYSVYRYDVDTSLEELRGYIQSCDFMFHLAGVNRPEKTEDFRKGNVTLLEEILGIFEEEKNFVPIVLSSSIQAELDNPYGKSKLEGENLLREYGRRNKSKVYVFRLPNLFGKWSKPNYNSVVSTFCHNIAHGLSIQINDPGHVLTLCYIDDVLTTFTGLLEENTIYEDKIYSVDINYQISLGELAEVIQSFKLSRENLEIPNCGEELYKKLYSTYLSYLPEGQFSYPLEMHTDQRGSFTEMLKSDDRGQVSVNITKPGITKGNHWHHSKNEKFIVVQGKALIKFRQVLTDKVIEYYTSDEKIEVVDIPTGYTHSIQNIGSNDLITIMWANEKFDPENPDTFYLEV